MIFAKVDVSLPRHHRFVDVRADVQAEALGVWLTALCYTREQELDGFCPLRAISHVARAEVLAELVRVGLLAVQEKDGQLAGYVVCKYAEHNETRAQIDKRRKKDRVRKASVRKDVGIPRGVPVGVRVDSSVDSVRIPGQFPDSDSDSVSLISEGEREREPGPATEATLPPGRVRVVRTANDDGAFGGSVDAWADGVRSAHAALAKFATPAGGVATRLVAAFVAQRWGPDVIVDKAREAGAAYARHCAGRTVNPLGYPDWEGSGRPPRPGLARVEADHAEPKPTPDELRRRRAAADERERKRLDTLYREAAEGAKRFEEQERKRLAEGKKP
jgi:hypothetical protein